MSAQREKQLQGVYWWKEEEDEGDKTDWRSLELYIIC